MKYILLIGGMLFLNGKEEFSPNHALHLATLQITQDESFTQMRLTVFQDDCQDALINAFPEKKITRSNQFSKSHFEDLSDYFITHLSIFFDGQKQLFFLDTVTPENDVYHLHFKANFPVKWNEFEIQATYFFELFEDQTNTIALVLKQDNGYRWLKTTTNQNKVEGHAF